MSGYRDDLAAARSRVEQLERELAAERVNAAELGEARDTAARLERENAELRHGQYALPRHEVRRVVLGVAIAVLAGVDVIASWGTVDGEPPYFGLEAGPFAAVGALVGAWLVGFAGQLRPLAHALLAATGALLVLKPLRAPVSHTWMGEVSTFGMSSETHYYFFVPGILALVLTAILFVATRPKPRA